MYAYIKIKRDECKSCGLCIAQCPKNLIGISERINSKGVLPIKFKDPKKKCTGCGFCFLTCPDAAIEVYRRE